MRLFGGHVTPFILLRAQLHVARNLAHPPRGPWRTSSAWISGLSPVFSLEPLHLSGVVTRRQSRGRAPVPPEPESGHLARPHATLHPSSGSGLLLPSPPPRCPYRGGSLLLTSQASSLRLLWGLGMHPRGRRPPSCALLYGAASSALRKKATQGRAASHQAQATGQGHLYPRAALAPAPGAGLRGRLPAPDALP